jgi:diaminopimelate decarboxylase
MDLSNGKYKIGGVDALSIANEFGSPVYVYDANKIIKQYETLKQGFSDVKLKLYYACKALTNLNILKLLKEQGAGCDAVSIQEVELALLAGFDPQDILFTPNGVSFKEIKKAVAKGVRINIDNLSVLEVIGNEYGNTLPVCVRINPHIMAGGHSHISVGHIDSKFGISYYQMRHVARIVENYNINVNGLHMHTGSDMLDADVFLRGADLLFDAAKEYFPNLEFLDFGSGFKVPYKEGDISTDVAEIGEKITKSFSNFCKEYGRELTLCFEPGKFLVSESGYLLVNTNVIKQTTSTMFAGVDSGQNHLLRPMMYDAYHHITNVSNPVGDNKIYSVVGYICENDTLGWDRKLTTVSEGDILAIHNAGAYGFSMSSNYNSRFRPAEVLVENGKARLIRKRETMEDLVKNQIFEV